MTPTPGAIGQSVNRISPNGGYAKDSSHDNINEKLIAKSAKGAQQMTSNIFIESIKDGKKFNCTGMSDPYWTRANYIDNWNGSYIGGSFNMYDQSSDVKITGETGSILPNSQSIPYSGSSFSPSFLVGSGVLYDNGFYLGSDVSINLIDSEATGRLTYRDGTSADSTRSVGMPLTWTLKFGRLWNDRLLMYLSTGTGIFFEQNVEESTRQLGTSDFNVTIPVPIKVGFGFERMINNYWRWFGEFEYWQIPETDGQLSIGNSTSTSVGSYSVQDSLTALKIGLIYRF